MTGRDSDLQTRLLAAHQAADNAALVTLYQEAAQHAASETAEAFYLTHAYVFALEIGAPAAAEIKARLVAMGRDTP